MRKSEIVVGGHYTARVSGNLVTVRVDTIERDGPSIFGGKGREHDIYRVTNLATGRKTTFRSAAKFRAPAKGPKPASTRYKGGHEEDPMATRVEVEQRPDPSLPTSGGLCVDINCPRCGKAVIVTDGRYAYHKHLTKGITCGMSGEKVPQPEDSKPVDPDNPNGPKRNTEGEQSADPTPTLKEPDTSLPIVSQAERFGSNPQASPGLLSGLKPSLTAVTPPHVIVTARAGTGKTTTLIEGLKQMRGLSTSITPSPQQRDVWDQLMLSKDARTVCFVAFNRSIAQELKDRVPPGCEASTMHSMGLKAVTRAFGRLEVSEYVVPDILAEILNTDVRQLRKNQPAMLKATADLVSLCKMNLVGGPGQFSGLTHDSAGTPTLYDWREPLDWEVALSDLASHYDVDLNGSRRQVFDLVPQVLDRCRDPKRQGRIDYGDMIWLPVVLDLPVFRHDLLLVDECVPGWTPVMMADGTSVTIKEIVESKKEFQVRSYDTKTGQSKNCRVIGKQKILNQKPIVKVKVQHLHRTGTNRKCNFVVCTTDHKVWTVNRGWIPAGNLRVGDDVIVETAATTTQKGKITQDGRKKLASLQIGNVRGLGNRGGDPATFNRVKGGNGHGLTLAEHTLMEALGFGWGPAVVKTGDAPQFGRGDKPSHYKIDLAEQNLRIAIEVDGPSHRNRQEVDSKKQQFLESRGWTVVRVSNRDAIQRTSSVVAQIIDLVNRVGMANCPRPARVLSVRSVTIPDSYVYDITVEDCHNFYANGILVHNCQDLNRCQQALAKKAGKRLILVGDERQAIYGFAGADSESIPRMQQELESEAAGCVVLPLTVTRRCGKRIVEEAKRYVPDFEAHESNPEGEVKSANYPRYKDSLGVWRERPWEQTYGPAVKEGDMVLCRTNAPLVSQCFRFLKRGIKANIQGRDVGQGLVALVKKSKAEQVPDLLSWLEDWHDAERKKENAKKIPSETRLEALTDRYQCLLCFTEGLTSVAMVIAKIESVFTDDKTKPGVKFSSVHKSKGLEARNVFILYPPEGRPRTDRMKPEELVQEDNIQYVAVTRAIDVLTYVN